MSTCSVLWDSITRRRTWPVEGLFTRVTAPEALQECVEIGEKTRDFHLSWDVVVGSLVVLVVLCGAYSVSYSQPPWRTRHGCTVGIDWDPPVWCSHPSRTTRTPERQLLRDCARGHNCWWIDCGVVLLNICRNLIFQRMPT